MQFNPNVYNHHAGDPLKKINPISQLGNGRILEYIDKEILLNIANLNEQIDVLSVKLSSVCKPITYGLTQVKEDVSIEVGGVGASPLRSHLEQVNLQLQNLYTRMTQLNDSVDSL